MNKGDMAGLVHQRVKRVCEEELRDTAENHSYMTGNDSELLYMILLAAVSNCVLNGKLILRENKE